MEWILAMAQINPHVGDLEGNLETALAAARRAREAGAALIVFPELSLTGYPPEDLLHKPLFLERAAGVEQRLIRELGRLEIDAVFGSPTRVETAAGARLQNAAVVVLNGAEAGRAVKQRLPNYGVFDEQRYFEPGEEVRLFHRQEIAFGVTICEDIWSPGGPLQALAEAGAALAINLNASPYRAGKQREREGIVARRCAETGLPMVYVNQVGGQDELVFDGGSFAMNPDGGLVAASPPFRETLTLLRVRSGPEGPRLAPVPEPLIALNPTPSGHAALPDPDGFLSASFPLPPLSREREIWEALCLGLRDYVGKNGFSGVVLGLSGGIDSALTAAVAADALGAERVEAVMMPSPYTSADSLADAADGARRLGIRLSSIAIGPLFDGFKEALAAEFAGRGEDVTEENIQPRIRATLLMAISNKKGSLLVTTGNKSEVSVGYATLYGDMAGGFSVLKDVLKTTVYDLARARNHWAEAAGLKPPVPERIITKAPTAELKPGQKDSDTLPPYPELDRILSLYVEQERGLVEIVAQGIDRDVAVRVIRMVDRNEYKRRQSCPGVRITPRAFGKDRRYPITNGFQVT